MNLQRRQRRAPLVGDASRTDAMGAKSPPRSSMVPGSWNHRLLRVAYCSVAYLTVPFMLIHLVVRARRDRQYLRRVNERFGFSPAPRGSRDRIWIHALSVGEVQAMVPLIRQLLAMSDRVSVLVTTTTPSGSDTVRRVLGDAVAHCYLPWDLPGATARFLERVRPSIALILETELWPNLFAACEQRRIPLMLVNARLSARSVRRYSMVSALVTPMLAQARAILARGPDDARHFLALGATCDRVRAAGDIKFDYTVPVSLVESGAALRRTADGCAIWVAACTHPGEEAVLLDAHLRLRRRNPDLILVLVPRHRERFAAVAALCEARDLTVVRRSSGLALRRGTGVMLGDTMGEMPLYYAMADVAFIGGTLVPVGGHSPVEAAAQGLPILVGPNVHKITDTMRLLRRFEAVTQVTDAVELSSVLERLFGHAEARRKQGENARRLVRANRGVTRVVLRELLRHLRLPPEGSPAG